MKKLGFLLPVMISICLGVLFVQCKKDHDCKMKIICNFSDNGIDTGQVVPHAYIVVGKENYGDYARVTGYTDTLGVFEHTFPHPALLEVTATYSDTLPSGRVEDYTGSARIEVNEGETTEKIILMTETAL